MHAKLLSWYEVLCAIVDEAAFLGEPLRQIQSVAINCGVRFSQLYKTGTDKDIKNRT